jgi:hypothetical protein
MYTASTIESLLRHKLLEGRLAERGSKAASMDVAEKQH